MQRVAVDVGRGGAGAARVERGGQAGKGQAAAVGVAADVERLLAHAVAAQEQPALVCVVDREGEHAVQVLGQLVAEGAVAVEQGFGVGVVAAELVAATFELAPQLAVVVNFAVKDQRERAAAGGDPGGLGGAALTPGARVVAGVQGHGLLAREHVDDGQPAVDHAARPVYGHPRAVGPAVGQVLGHRAEA